MATLTTRPVADRRRDDAVPLARYGRRLRRSLPWVGAGAVLGLLAGVALVLATPVPHRAYTVVLINDVPVLINDRPGDEQDRTRVTTVDTEARRIRSAPVTAAMQAAAGRGAAEPELTITAVPHTKALRLTVRAESQEAARAAARAAATTYLDLRGRWLQDRRRQRLEALDRDHAELTAQVERAAGDPAAAVRAAGLTAEVQRNREAATRVHASPVAPGMLLRDATDLPARRDNPTVPPASGLFAGALVGAAGYRLRGRRVHSPADARDLVPVATAVRLPVPLPRHGLERLAADLAGAAGTGRPVLAVVPVDDEAALPAADLSTGLARLLTGTGPYIAPFDGDGRLRDADLLRTLDDLCREHEGLVLACPPAGSPTTALVAGRADRTVLVLRPGAPETTVTAAARAVHRAGGRIGGMLIAGTRRSPGAGILIRKEGA